MYTIVVPQDRNHKYQMFRYPAGEMQVRLGEPQEDLVAQELEGEGRFTVVANIRNGDDLMELAQLTDALRFATQGTEKSMRLVLPYLPYSRADRRFTQVDCFGLKVFGNIIDSLGYERVTTLDVHSMRSKSLVSNLVNDVGMNLIADALDKIDPYIVTTVGILLPDKGAQRYGIETILQCEKERNPVTGEILGFKVPPTESFQGCDSILVVDDICDGGGTFIGLAERLKAQGVSLPLYLYVTHGIFSKGTDELLKYYKGIFSSNSFTEQFKGVTRLEWDVTARQVH